MMGRTLAIPIYKALLCFVIQKLQFSNLFSMLVVSKQRDSEKTTFSCAHGEGRGGAGTVNL